jgi:ribosomal protein L5
MDITFVIKNAKSKEEAKELLRLFGMPFSTD